MIKKFFKNSWVIGIGTGTISGFILLVLADWYNHTPILTSLKIGSVWLFENIVVLMNYDTKAWVYGLTIILIVASNRYLKHRRNQATLIPTVNNQIIDNDPSDIDNIPAHVLEQISNDAEKKHENRIEKEKCWHTLLINFTDRLGLGAGSIISYSMYMI